MRRTPVRALLPFALFWALLCAAGGGRLGAQPPEGGPPYAETVVVVESSVVVELPSNRPEPRPEEILVIEGGASREVVRIEPLAREGEWELLIWIDGALCQAESFSSTILALATRADALARLGRVRVVIAGEEVREALAPTREPLAIAAALASLSRDETVCADLAAGTLWEAREAATPAEAEPVLDRMADLVAARHRTLAEAAGRCPHDACAVLMVAHGYPLELDLALPEELRGGGALAAGARLARSTDELARRLALARWALVALPFLPPPPGGVEDDEVPRGARGGPDAIPRGEHMPSGYGRKRDKGESGPPIWRIWPRGRPRRERVERLPPKAWDVFVLPSLAPLRALADGTGGMLLRVPDQIEPALQGLAGRVRVWYRTTPLAAGEVRPLVVLFGSPPRRGLGPAWVGATPGGSP